MRKLFLGISLILFYSSIFSQRLIQNPNFEIHSSFSQYAKPHESNINYLRDWKVFGFGVCNYCHTDLEIKKVKNHRTCANSIIPHSGKGMVKMMYVEACPDISNITGCASYIQSELITPLVVGNIYEISFWIYFPSTPGVDSNIFSNIGFYLSLHPDKVGTHELFETEYFFSSSIECDKWYQVKKHIRALCPLKYITIGPFKNDIFPSLHRPVDVQTVYYIDDVSINQIEEANVKSDIQVTPFCNYFEKREYTSLLSESSNFNVYFDLNKYELSIKDSIKLQSTLNHIDINQSSVIVLAGHTDSIGNENYILSVNRIESIKSILKTKYNLTDLNFISFPMGSSTPKATNKTSEGRALNRRVTILLSKLNPSSVIYRRAIEHINSNELALAAKELKKWISSVDQDTKIKLLFDYRLNKLKHTSTWDFLTNEIKKSYVVYKSEENAFFLDSLYFEDQKYRSYNPYLITGFFSDYETSNKSLDLQQYNNDYSDSISLMTAKYYLSNNNFPIISEVGRRAVRGLINILNHSNDTSLLNKFLPIIFKNCNLGEAEWDSYAMIKDKIQILNHKTQLYGTQKMILESEFGQAKLYPLDNIDSVNIRRAKIGLIPLSID